MINKIKNWVEKANLIHNNRYDYSKIKDLTSKAKVAIICKEHGEFYQRADSHLSGKGCPKCAYEERSLSKEIFIERAQSIHKNKYDYSKVIFKTTKDKVCIICPDHGEFWQEVRGHIYSENGCPKCFRKSVTKDTDEFIKDAIRVHENKYDYSLVEYINSVTKVNIICPMHGNFQQVPNSHLNGNGCPKCNSSKMEKVILKILKEHNVDFIYQYEIIINGLARNSNKILIDFYLKILDKQYFIEYDGQQHFEYVPFIHKGGHIDFEKEIRRDKALQNYCDEHKEICLIRYNYLQTEEEIKESLIKLINN